MKGVFLLSFKIEIEACQINRPVITKNDMYILKNKTENKLQKEGD